MIRKSLRKSLRYAGSNIVNKIILSEGVEDG